MLCYEIVYYKPLRQRSLKRWVIGVTNYDYCTNMYRLIFEIDTHDIDMSKLFDNVDVAMLLKTRKGYHVYSFEKYATINELYDRLHSLTIRGLADAGYLALLQSRMRHKYAYTVLRVSQKYAKRDLRFVYVSDITFDAWLSQVYALINLLNPRR